MGAALPPDVQIDDEMLAPKPLLDALDDGGLFEFGRPSCRGAGDFSGTSGLPAEAVFTSFFAAELPVFARIKA
jgi:hypothetical protein